MALHGNKTGCVLVVEDEAENAALLPRLFRSDMNFVAARSISEARSILQTDAVDVVIAELRLRDGTGVDLLRDVAVLRPNVGRLLVTVSGDCEEVMDACSVGIVERFFLKPYSPQRLKSAVLELLRRRGAAARPLVLVADSDPSTRRAARDLLERRFFEVVEVEDGEAALLLAQTRTCDVALIDHQLTNARGLALLEHLHRLDPDLPVIVVTPAAPNVGLSLLEAGAFDLVAKPIRPEELTLRLERAVWTRQQTAENRQLRLQVDAVARHEQVVAESASMRQVLAQVPLLAKHDVDVLITGETGSGKEVLARLLHRESHRAPKPFIPVNCGAIPETLIENQLFGHERGAFTDAKAQRYGVFESAHGGTLFLDEIGELSLSAQVHLLRVLERKEVTRLGGARPVRVDVRVVVATHRDLEVMVREGKFREDLYFRLNGFRVHVPPLRERPEDIVALLRGAVAQFCAKNALPVPEISATALRKALAYGWPGNVRELLHVVERTLITRGPGVVDDLELPQTTPATRAGCVMNRLAPNPAVPLKEALAPIVAALEKQYLVGVLQQCHGRLGLSAQHAGIHRKSLYNKLKRYGIHAGQAPTDPLDP